MTRAQAISCIIRSHELYGTDTPEYRKSISEVLDAFSDSVWSEAIAVGREGAS